MENLRGLTMSKTFAVLTDNTVSNVIIAETKEIAEQVTQLTCVEYTDEEPAGIGWTYDGTKFIQPVIEIIEELTQTSK
jgi:hypothetical protein